VAADVRVQVQVSKADEQWIRRQLARGAGRSQVAEVLGCSADQLRSITDAMGIEPGRGGRHRLGVDLEPRPLPARGPARLLGLLPALMDRDRRARVAPREVAIVRLRAALAAGRACDAEAARQAWLELAAAAAAAAHEAGRACLP
jgi:hypothetical protein